MEDEKQYFPEMTTDIIENVTTSVNRYYQEVTITKIDGECPFGHQVGEVYRTTATNHDGLCGSLYHAIHAPIATFHYGGRVLWENDPKMYRGLCPEKGRVQVEVQCFEKEDSKPFRTKAKTRDMTGKGFPELDKYKIYLEILGVDKHCMWGHREGQKFEVDIFNIGGVCGFLYWETYHFINHLLVGASLPWEPDVNIVHGVCPDVYNQTIFRLVREERKKPD